MKLPLTARACPVCGSDDDRSVFADEDFDPDSLDAFAFASRKLPEYMHYRLVECPRCDAVYASPAPPPEFLAKAYLEADYDSAEEAALAARTYARYLGKLAPGLAGSGGALDIGAGDGAFLEQLIRAGFDPVVGVEPSSAPVEAAKPGIRPLIRRETFSPEGFEPGSFALVTCFQTMEHVFAPSELCRDVLSLLRPGGAALFVCHNRRALSARVLGFKSPIFDIEHLQLFS
ncbi:MAG TPA: class I SAM-dependent methyltransferase, partial [Actinomycetota bacterium]|nr:class I SAM-dependent methyltransferase [Actinomycetota bacterium]